jgi:hypothetical protein
VIISAKISLTIAGGAPPFREISIFDTHKGFVVAWNDSEHGFADSEAVKRFPRENGSDEPTLHDA